MIEYQNRVGFLLAGALGVDALSAGDLFVRQVLGGQKEHAAGEFGVGFYFHPQPYQAASGAVQRSTY